MQFVRQHSKGLELTVYAVWAIVNLLIWMVVR